MTRCGLDEAGRGALAGPLVAAGVVLLSPITGLADSKILSKSKRNELFEVITLHSKWCMEMISVSEINRFGIGWANREVFSRLIEKIPADYYVVDGNLKLNSVSPGKKVECKVDADATVECVMAASILAKVIRDRWMEKLESVNNKYGWGQNAGYGTRIHIQALKQYGKSIHHRDLYVQTALQNAKNN